MLSEKNVRFYMNDNVTEVRGVDGKVKWTNTHCASLVYQIQTRPSANTEWHFVLGKYERFQVFLSHCAFLLKVKEVVLKSGKVIPAEVLIVGIGKCNTHTFCDLPIFITFSIHYLHCSLTSSHYQCLMCAETTG